MTTRAEDLRVASFVYGLAAIVFAAFHQGYLEAAFLVLAVKATYEANR